MVIAHIGGAGGLNGHGAVQLNAALHGVIQILLTPLLAGDGAHILGFHAQVALIAALLAGAEGHGPYPVAQGEAVMQHLTHDAELGKARLALVHGGVILGRVQAAFAEQILYDGLLDGIGQAGAGDVDDGVAHAVAVVEDVGQLANLRVALVAVVALGANGAPQADGLAVQVLVAQDVVVLFGDVVRAHGQVVHGVVGIEQALGDIVHEGQVAVIALGPVDGVEFLFSQDLLHQLVVVLHEVLQRRGQLAVVLPQTQIVGQDRAVHAANQLAVAFLLHVVKLGHQGGEVEAVLRAAGVGMGADHAGGLFHLRNVHAAEAADGAHGAARHLDGVLFSDRAMVEHSLLAAIADQRGLAGGGFAGIDGAAFGSAPGHTGMARPAGRFVVILGPGLGNAGHDVVVVGAKQIADDVLVQRYHALGIGNLGALGAVEHHGLELLGAKHLAQAAAAAVTDAGHHAAEVEQRLARRADGHDVGGGIGFLGQDRGGVAGGLAPNVGRVADFDLIVVYIDVYGGVAGALDDHGVKAAVLHAHGGVAAHVRIDDGVILGEGGQGRNGDAAGAGRAGAGVGAHGENDLVFGRGGIGAHGHFVIHNAVGHALAADIFEILFAAFDAAGFGRQVDAQQITHPSVHGFYLLLIGDYSALATSSQGIMRRALVGQPATQAPQLMHLVDLCFSTSTRGICQGQALTHAPQPTHLSSSMTRAPVTGSAEMAFMGQALTQAGSAHCLQVSGLKPHRPKKPSPCL